jgi:hypothetical protein
MDAEVVAAEVVAAEVVAAEVVAAEVMAAEVDTEQVELIDAMLFDAYVTVYKFAKNIVYERVCHEFNVTEESLLVKNVLTNLWSVLDYCCFTLYCSVCDTPPTPKIGRQLGFPYDKPTKWAKKLKLEEKNFSRFVKVFDKLQLQNTNPDAIDFHRLHYLRNAFTHRMMRPTFTVKFNEESKEEAVPRESNEEAVESNKEAVESNIEAVESNKGAVESNKGAVESNKEAVSVESNEETKLRKCIETSPLYLEVEVPAEPWNDESQKTVTISMLDFLMDACKKVKEIRDAILNGELRQQKFDDKFEFVMTATEFICKKNKDFKKKLEHLHLRCYGLDGDYENTFDDA